MSKEIELYEAAKELAETKRDNYLLKKEGVVRFISRKANVVRTESVTDFSEYVDDECVAATDPARYNLGLNKLVVKLFKKTKDEMNELELEAVTDIDRDIAKAHFYGQKSKLTRKQIKANAKAMATRGYEHYKEKMKFLGVEA